MPPKTFDLRAAMARAVAKAGIDLPCPKCGHKTKETIAWIKANDKFACGGCGAEIALDRDEIVRDLGK